MRSIFSTLTFFYFVATALASQPDKLKLYGEPRTAAAASLAVQKAKGKASKLVLHEGHERKLPTHPKIKTEFHDPDRRLTQEGSIRGGNKEVSTQHKRSLQDWDTAFEARVAMPIRLQSMMKKASGDSNRRLQTGEVECFVQDNGLIACVQSDYPGEGVSTVFVDCPTDASSVLECQSCYIGVPANENDYDWCQSCSICSDTVAWDCSNLFEGDCVIADCDGCVNDTPTPPTPPSPGPNLCPFSSTCLPQGEGADLCVAPGDDYMSVMNCCSLCCCSKSCKYGAIPDADGFMQYTFGTCT